MGMCVAEGHVWRGCAWHWACMLGVCVAGGGVWGGGACVGDGHAWGHV